MFEILSLLFFLVFFLVLGIILVNIFRGIKEWNHNNHSPRLTVDATVVAKRTNVSHHHRSGSGVHHSTSTTYFVTFQFDSGDRMEQRWQEVGLHMQASHRCCIRSIYRFRYLYLQHRGWLNAQHQQDQDQRRHAYHGVCRIRSLPCMVSR